MPEAYFPHPGALRRVYIGLDHFPYAGLQSTLNGRLRIREQPFVVKMGVRVYKHGYKVNYFYSKW